MTKDSLFNSSEHQNCGNSLGNSSRCLGWKAISLWGQQDACQGEESFLRFEMETNALHSWAW